MNFFSSLLQKLVEVQTKHPVSAANSNQHVFPLQAGNRGLKMLVCFLFFLTFYFCIIEKKISANKYNIIHEAFSFLLFLLQPSQGENRQRRYHRVRHRTSEQNSPAVPPAITCRPPPTTSASAPASAGRTGSGAAQTYCTVPGVWAGTRM